jgi:arylsulfatase
LRNRPASSLALIASALLTTCDPGPSAPPRIVPPRAQTDVNVLLIVVDTLRADHLGCYGYPRATSPAIDELARRSLRFPKCYTAWPETCESMAAIFSGMYCQANGVVVNTPQALPRAIETLAETLQDGGWATAAFVTNTCMTGNNHYDQGFDHFVDVFEAPDPVNFKSETDLAEAWIAEQKGHPFFAWVHYTEPHAPYCAESAPDRFVGDRFCDPTRRVKFLSPEIGWSAFGGIPKITQVEGHDELDYYIARYDAEVAIADAKIGHLLKTVDELGLREQTLVVFTSDHGEGFGEHDYFWHGAMPFNDTAHVPLLIAAPRVLPGVARQLASTIDLAPTILEWLGLEIPKRYQGISLLPSLAAPDLAEPRIVYTESGYDHHDDIPQWQISAYDGRWKLIVTRSENERRDYKLPLEMLYDLDADPGERNDLFAGRADVARPLENAIKGWVRSRPIFSPIYSAEQADNTAEQNDRIKKLGYGAGGEGQRPRGKPPGEK